MLDNPGSAPDEVQFARSPARTRDSQPNLRSLPRLSTRSAIQRLHGLGAMR